MAQTAEGAIKVAAGRIGLSVSEYVARQSAGLKRCTKCGGWRPRSAFQKDSTRYDGLTAACGDCRRQINRKRYEPVPEGDRATPGPARVERRDGDTLQARARINADVRQGLRPNPNDLHCALCGHKGNDRRHEYHHHMGYGRDHHYDVLPLCARCHHEEHADG